MVNNIKHLGIVESINGSYVKVRISQSSACSSCSVKGHCSVSETKEKLIDVFNKNEVTCQVGERVMIVGTTSMGMKAVFWAFVLPFLWLMTVLVLILHFTGNEPVAALASLGSLIPYYLVIYLCRHKLTRTFTFTLESIV
ncbi:SoxR reducing system RseC family protein [uncultured Bacteroides sp.]|uniref:SoxR reducing system RseC family protein n=1 Tax=uncultured Bacteroides sp. TaxID=162156 RepID=UPI00262D3E82|nr:SoxR reducing system RseC family protein [uncultured Bacteroides sp.]